MKNHIHATTPLEKEKWQARPDGMVILNFYKFYL
jgi:hypothetical protein